MSCLFNSLHHFIPNESSHSIRQKICDYLQNNSPIMDGLDTAVILELDSGAVGAGKYIEIMRRESTWGGAIEIQTACNVWSFRIIVRNNRGREKSSIEFLPISELWTKTIELEWTGGHYEPVRA